MRTSIATLVLVILLLAGGAAFVFSGMYDVSATVPHSPVTRWLFNTTMQQSVRARARGIQAPAFDESMVKSGYLHYAENCVSCHGAPGVERGELGKGINPEAPDLSKTAARWEAAELFWIVKNGVRMTAMPAWGPTHSDEEIWTIVAFARQLPEMSPEQYRALQSQTRASGQAEHHHAKPEPKGLQVAPHGDKSHSHKH